MTLKIDSLHEAKIETLEDHGLGLTIINNQKVFIHNGIPGDEATIKIIKKRRKFITGKIIELKTPSPYRKKPICDHFSKCGGCQLLDIDYNDQLKFKQTLIEKKFQSLSNNYNSLKINPILECEIPIYYRNKMEFSFGTDQKSVYLGLKERGNYKNIIKLSHCYLQSKETNTILSFTNSFFTKHNISVWDHEKHTGILRYLVIRHSKTTNTFSLNLVASENKPDLFNQYTKEITQKMPEIQTVLLSIQDQISDTSWTQNQTVLFGNPNLIETFESINFSISPTAFFQTNTHQARYLYKTIKKLGNFKQTDTLLDLYSGTGTIGLFLSDAVKEVIGIEENPESVKDAIFNAKSNSIKNATFYTGRVKNILKFNEFKADKVIIDPPRSGMVPKALKRMLAINAPQIIYVSCNLTTLIQDLDVILSENYQIDVIQPVDMFPNTFHCEFIVILNKKLNKK